MELSAFNSPTDSDDQQPYNPTIFPPVFAPIKNNYLIYQLFEMI